jgi:hypothetical protein
MLALAGMQAPAFALQRSGADTNSDQRDWLVQNAVAAIRRCRDRRDPAR